ncbi:THO complex subunit 5B-like isoform X2 [Carica papaya]|uniref:THO complex subunit 5B-like isoform X2 n=1 Tax=Carica papaya TaxID=3649 RepID=UPI000B8CFED0|nr:THO complex subunit 5B-like isoform X2 [Carica papaya]
MEDDEIEEGMVIEDDEQVAPPPPKIEKSAYDMLRDSKASVEKIVAKMLAMKKEGKPKSELKEILTQMFLNFVNLRQANRSILLQEDRVKAETERAKAPVDLTTLQLHNLMYEKSHYVKAIKACKDFKSKYPDIELVPEEEFLRDAPEDIKGQKLSSDISHDLMLKRLNYELYQRKELCKLRARLEQHKKSLLETIASRKKFLSTLPSHLKSLKKASLPVQNQLGLLHTKKLKQHHSTELLPPPLYVLYSQLLAQKEAFGENIELEIVGSLKDAQASARQQANKDPGLSSSVESSRLEDDAPDEEDDGQRRRKRPKRISSKEGIDQSRVYQVHPLKVLLHIFDDEAYDPKSVKLITLRFEYMSKLNVVCVAIEGSENDILCNLFPDDMGVELPHQSAKLLVGDGPAFDENRVSRPYKWAQHLAGIDFLPELPPLFTGQEPSTESAKSDTVVSGLQLYRQQNRVQTVVQRIRSRKRLSWLLEQLDLLTKLKWPALDSESVPWALHTPLCSLYEWSAIGPLCNQISSLPVNSIEQSQEPVDVGMDGRSGPSREEAEGAREDGELPSLVSFASSANDIKLNPNKGPNLEHSRQLTLISKSTISPLGKSQSFKKYDDSDLMLDIDCDLDEPAPSEVEIENAGSGEFHERADNSWMDYGVREYYLTLSRKMDAKEKDVKLKAKIKISREYPLRPPLLALSLHACSEEDYDDSNNSGGYNELRSMEAEVNLHMLKMVSVDQENYILSHQLRCLAMLFDYYMDDGSPSSEVKKSSSVIDVGLCKPVSGKLLARSFRGRDRRRMISWKDTECASGFPC